MFKHLDIPFCRKVLEFAEDEYPDFRHDQATFYTRWLNGLSGCQPLQCGTSACMAGIANMLSDRVEIHPNPDVGLMGQVSHLVYRNGNFDTWDHSAMMLMGLGSGQAKALFLIPWTAPDQEPQSRRPRIYSVATSRQQRRSSHDTGADPAGWR